MHHRLLELLSRDGDSVTVMDYDISWSKKGLMPLFQSRTETVHSKVIPGSQIAVIRPGMVRLPVIGRLSWLLGNWRELKRILANDRPDVIVAYGISNALLALVMARSARVRFVFHVLDALHTLAGPRVVNRVARVVEAQVMRFADLVIVINDALADYARSMGALPHRVAVLPAGSARHVVSTSQASRLRISLGLTPSDVALLFVGHLYEFSGLREVALDLMNRRQEFTCVKLVVVGDGDIREELQAIAARYDGRDQLIVLGSRPIEEIPLQIAASDVCLLPAVPVPAMEHIVPVKVGEYMELGKPIVATELPGLTKEFGALPGILYVHGPESVLDRVKEAFLTSPQPRKAAKDLGKSCLTFARSRPDWEQASRRFRGLLAGESA
jgi:glycosyltransferase involved in cell wall biosynthesis